MDKKVFLITGASSGIGKATAEAAATMGYKLILTARREKLLNELVESLGGSDNALAVPADATSYEELQKVVDQGVQHFGQLDIVFANAGTGVNQPGTEKGDPKEWDQLIDINCKGLLWTAKASLPHLRKTQGHFLLTASVAGRIPLKGSIYGASKWFAYGFGQNLAREMEEWKGRCTTICPGVVNTPFFDQPKENKLKPGDVAEAVLYAINADPRNNIREVMMTPTNVD